MLPRLRVKVPWTVCNGSCTVKLISVLEGIQLESSRARHSAGDADKKPNQVPHETANTSDVAPTCTASSYSKIAGWNAFPRIAIGRSQGNRSSDSIRPAINAGRRISRR